MEEHVVSLQEKAQAGFAQHLRARDARPATVRHRMGEIKVFLRFVAERGLDLRAATSQTVLDYREYLRHVKSQYNMPMSIWTQNGMMGAVRAFYRYLVDAGLAIVDPTDGVAIHDVTLQHRLVRDVLSPEEMRTFLECGESVHRTGLSVRDQAIVEVLYSTGLRLSEMAALRVEDVDMYGGFVRVRAGKGGKGRVVPTGKTACEWLKRYVTDARRELVGKRTDSGALWISRHGKELEPPGIYYTIKARAKALGLRVSPHTLRRTFATHLLKNGADPLYVQRMLGHSHLNTLSRYTKLYPHETKKVHHKTHPREQLPVGRRRDKQCTTKNCSESTSPRSKRRT